MSLGGTYYPSNSGTSRLTSFEFRISGGQLLPLGKGRMTRKKRRRKRRGKEEEEIEEEDKKEKGGRRKMKEKEAKSISPLSLVGQFLFLL